MKIFKELSNAISKISKGSNNCAMPQYVIDEINRGGLPVINVNILNLLEDEFCCYADYASTYKDTTKVAGYTGKNAGFNVRIAKGLSYRTGGSGGQAIRNTQRTTYNGMLLLTNKRIIFASNGISFDKPINKISSIIPTNNGLVFQIGQKTYEIQVESANLFNRALTTLKNNPNCKIGDKINSICPNCGMKVNGNYCSNCGSKID
ncbi:MAG: hypothetical protein IJG68_08100 [Bacilli bacterium]|nr:hypothetical protein [Bacilli bacterium]